MKIRHVDNCPQCGPDGHYDYCEDFCDWLGLRDPAEHLVEPVELVEEDEPEESNSPLCQLKEDIPTPNPEHLLVEKERALFVRKALWSITTREELVLRARFFGDRTLKEIGGDIGLSAERVRSIQNRAISKLSRSQCLRKLDFAVVKEERRRHCAAVIRYIENARLAKSPARAPRASPALEPVRDFRHALRKRKERPMSKADSRCEVCGHVECRCRMPLKHISLDEESQDLLSRIVDGHRPTLSEIEALHRLMHLRLLDCQRLRAWMRQAGDERQVKPERLASARETYGVLSEERFRRRQVARSRMQGLYKIPEQDADLWQCGVNLGDYPCSAVVAYTITVTERLALKTMRDIAVSSDPVPVSMLVDAVVEALNCGRDEAKRHIAVLRGKLNRAFWTEFARSVPECTQRQMDRGRGFRLGRRPEPLFVSPERLASSWHQVFQRLDIPMCAPDTFGSNHNRLVCDGVSYLVPHRRHSSHVRWLWGWDIRFSPQVKRVGEIYAEN